MNIERRLQQLESQAPKPNRLNKQQRKLAQKMIDASGCKQTIEQLDNGQNLTYIGLVLRAYGYKGEPHIEL